MKSLIQRILQSLLGFDTYLWWFTRYKLRVLHKDKSERDFFHFLQLIPQGATVLDIGANLGLMTFFMAEKAGSVHAFEPIPHNLKVLKRAQKKFSWTNVHLHPVALGDSNGRIELVLPEVNGVKKQGLSHVKHEKMEEFNEGELFSSPIHRLDDYAPLKDEKIAAIKIDVENFEYEVFKGASKLLQDQRPLIYCELWDNQNRQDCFELMKELGYSVQVLDGQSLVPYHPDSHQTQNFFFVVEKP